MKWVCIRCLDGDWHPWHDNGEINEAWEASEKDDPPEHGEGND